MTRLRNYFLTGFIVAAPLAITVYIVWSFIGWIDSWVKPYIPSAWSPDTYLPFAGAGLRPAGGDLRPHHDRLPGRQHRRTLDRLGRRRPARPHAAGARRLQGAEADFRDRRFPTRTTCSGRSASSNIRRKGVWSLVFVAAEKDTEINVKLDKEGDPLVAVFMPCTPNPTTGFLMYVYRSEIVMLDMTIEDGAKLIVSAGLVAPEYKRTVVTKDGAPIDVNLANPTMEKVCERQVQVSGRYQPALQQPHRLVAPEQSRAARGSAWPRSVCTASGSRDRISLASSRATSSRSVWNSMRATWKPGVPDCRVPNNSPSPRSFKSSSEIGKPSSVSRITDRPLLGRFAERLLVEQHAG